MLSVIANTTERQHTYRFSDTMVLPFGGANTFIQNGKTDLNAGRTALTMTQPGIKGSQDFIAEGATVYARVQSAVPGLSRSWCVESGRTHSPGSGISPVDPLTSIRNSGRALQRIGTDAVRGVRTTHYRVIGNPPLDIWVDGSDRLRRLRWTHGKANQTDTIDLYDFGASLEITVPTSAPPCSQPSCTLGTSFTQPPACGSTGQG
jgi:hypothetical protein